MKTLKESLFDADLASKKNIIVEITDAIHGHMKDLCNYKNNKDYKLSIYNGDDAELKNLIGFVWRQNYVFFVITILTHRYNKYVLKGLCSTIAIALGKEFRQNDFSWLSHIDDAIKNNTNPMLFIGVKDK